MGAECGDGGCGMDTAVLLHFGLTLADKLGSGWESRIYALGATRILRIPNPEPGTEAVVRARAAFTAGLPLLPFAVPRVREISHVEGILITTEDRIAPDRGKAWGGGPRAAGALCRMDCVQLCLQPRG